MHGKSISLRPSILSSTSKEKQKWHFYKAANSYFLLGDDHDDWEGRSKNAIQKIYPFVSEEVIPRREAYRFEQNKGHSGPGKPYPGISGVSGPIRMLLGRYAFGNDIEMDNRRQRIDDHQAH